MREAYVFGPTDTRMDMASGDRLVLGPEETGGAISVMVGTVVGPEGPPLHSHDDADELTMVVGGGPVTVQVGDDVHEIEAGGGYWAPRGVPHTFANFSDQPAMVVSVVTPSGMERMLDEQGRYFRDLPAGEAPDPARVAAIGAAHNSTVAGPPLVVTMAEGGAG